MTFKFASHYDSHRQHQSRFVCAGRRPGRPGASDSETQSGRGGGSVKSLRPGTEGKERTDTVTV